MTELWLVRHGETDWNREGLFQGHADIPLNETGLQQARATADALALAGKTFAALYSSPLSRARQTAEETARQLAMPLHLDERLREINQGEWTGKNYKMIRAQFGDPGKADGVHETIHSRAPGGESVAEVAARLAAAASDIARQHPGQAVLIFSHGLALATLHCQASGIPLQDVYQYIPKNGAATVVHWDAQDALPITT
jgi:broad specificity phosphatase PhoE